MGSRRRASSSTCRCSSTPPTRCSTIYRPTRWCAPRATSRARWSAPRGRSPSVTRNGGTTSSARCWRRTSCISRRRSSQAAARLPSRASTIESFKVEDAVPRTQLPDAPRRSEWRVDLRAEQPLAPLDRIPRHVSRARAAGRGFRRPARSAARDVARRMRSSPQPVAGWHEFVDGDARFAHYRGAGDGRAQHPHAADRGARRGAAVRPARAPGAPPAPRRVRSAGHPARPHDTGAGLAGRA